jgi:asparagine synthase (glutamine-hydrolysing)
MAAVFHRDQRPADLNTLAGMTAAMAHRGPDGIQHWQQGSVGFGHCMLHTTPESLRERLPRCAPLEGLAITADARIDNRRELSDALGLARSTSRDSSDSELILLAYQRWERDCVDHLIGDFAFLIWDEKRQQLFGARDHMGVRPFLYYLSDRLFVAASEVRSVRSHPGVDPQLNKDRIADFLVEPLEGIDRTSTFYRNISRLPPAHRITVTRNRVSIEHYWQLDPERELSLASDAAYTEAFRELLDEAVVARLRCNTQVGCMVSGGVDSSTIATVAGEYLAKSGTGPLRVYSGIADDGVASQESQCIRRVLASGTFDATLIRPGDIGPYESRLRTLFERQEEPFDNDMSIIQLVYLLCRERGDRVMLDGNEGDQCHSLSPVYPAFLIRRGHVFSACREVLGLWNNFLYPGDRTLAALLKKSVRPAFVPNWLRRWRSQQRVNTLAAAPLRASPIHPEFAGSADVPRRFARFRGSVGLNLPHSLREQHISSIGHPFMAVANERYNRVASLCGIEPRHPLLDKRLVEFSVSLPWNQKVRRGRSKHLLRLTAQTLLPQDIAWRQSYEDLGWEFTAARMHLLGDTMQRECVKMAEQLRCLIDDATLEQLLSGTCCFDRSEDSEVLWDIYSLALWLSGRVTPDAGAHNTRN